MPRFNAENPYRPIPVRLAKSWFEADSASLKNLLFEFVSLDDEAEFEHLPGQFCQISVRGLGEAPFGIASAPGEGNRLQFTISPEGALSEALRDAADGTIFGLRGPLGNSYPLQEFKEHDIVIAGGGHQFATLRSLFRYLVHPDNRDDYGKITVLYGAKAPALFRETENLPDWSEFPDVEIICTIDDAGSQAVDSEKLVPHVLKQKSPDASNAFAVIAGPRKMMQAALPVLVELGFSKSRICTSLERHMKCGIGKCGRCNVGHKYVCVDGPVFSIAELDGLAKDI